MSYWLPPPLDLPKRTTTLSWIQGPVDRGVIWFWRRRLELCKIFADDDPYTMSAATWNAFLWVQSMGGAPSWMRKPRRIGQVHNVLDINVDSLPVWQAGRSFMIVALPIFTGRCHDWNDAQRNGSFFLIARREGTRIRVYPRTLRASRHDALPSTIMRRASVERLEVAWNRAFDSLPRWAVTPEQKHDGTPYIAATLPNAHTPASGRFDTETIHPYWRNTKLALAAALALERIRLAPPPDEAFASYHWTVFAQRADISPGRDYAPLPLRVDVPFDGWSLVDEERATPDPGTARRLKRVERALARVFEQFAPNIPLFFDTLEDHTFVSLHGPSQDKTDIYGTGQFFPWMAPEEICTTGSSHQGLQRLSRLPADWRACLLEALDMERRRIDA